MQSKLIKVIVWRVISILITMGIVLILTGNIKEATGFTIFLHSALTIANYVFEVCWESKYESR